MFCYVEDEEEVLANEAKSHVNNHSYEKLSLSSTHQELENEKQVDDRENVGFHDN